jgi:hypothetical protein
MLLNNDLLFILGSLCFIGSGVFIISKYNFFMPINNESLVNTKSSLNSVSKLNSSIQLNNLPNNSYVDASVQTANINVEAGIQTANNYVNTGMQTSVRIWVESIRNWIDEILSTPNPNPNPQYVDVGVQTNTLSTWQTVKQWFLEVCSIRSSELSSMGQNKVAKWRNKLDSIQSVDLHDSASPLDCTSVISNSTLQQLVNPDDSASNISEVISEANLQKGVGLVRTVNRIYDMSNVNDVLDLMNDPTVVFSTDPVGDRDTLITFYTADSTNEILNSTLENLLTNVN